MCAFVVFRSFGLNIYSETDPRMLALDKGDLCFSESANLCTHDMSIQSSSFQVIILSQPPNKLLRCNSLFLLAKLHTISMSTPINACFETTTKVKEAFGRISIPS